MVFNSSLVLHFQSIFLKKETHFIIAGHLSHLLVEDGPCPSWSLHSLYNVVKSSMKALEHAAVPAPVSDGNYCTAE